MILPEHPPIETARLRIRLVDERDLPDLFHINRNDTVTRHLPYDSWRTPQDGEIWLDRMVARAEAGEAFQYVLERRQPRAVIGSLVIFRFEPGSGRAEIGYVLGQEHWGRGLMSEALGAFIQFAFGTLGLRRLEAEVDPRNTPSLRLLERLGFVREGLLRERWLREGEVSDSALYGLLVSDRTARMEDRRQPEIHIRRADPGEPGMQDLLQRHLEHAARHSPQESIHALDLDGLREPRITFWGAWVDGAAAGCGALRELDPGHGEIKSMHTAQAWRGRGVGRRLVAHILEEARTRGYHRVSLETGSMEGFAPARILYASFGFRECPPFAEYRVDSHSLCMTLELKPGNTAHSD